MGEEEIMQVLNKVITANRFDGLFTDISMIINAIQGLLDLYNKEKEKYKGIEEGTTIIYINKNAKYVREDKIEKYYISKNKIRAKIKEVEDEIKKRPTLEELDWQLDILKELLEEE